MRRDRLMLLDGGAPLSLATAWFPVDIANACPRLSQAGPIAAGTTRYVARVTGRSPVRGTDVVTVRLATDTEAELLQRDGPLAVAVVLHTASDEEGRALVVEEGISPSGLWEQMDNYPMGGGN